MSKLVRKVRSNLVFILLYGLLLILWALLELAVMGGMEFKFGTFASVDEAFAVVFVTGVLFGIAFWLLNGWVFRQLRRVAHYVADRLPGARAATVVAVVSEVVP